MRSHSTRAQHVGLWLVSLLSLLLLGPIGRHPRNSVAVLGDSVTEGTHTTPADPVGFLFLLRDRLQSLRWFNLGCGGTQTQLWAPPPVVFSRTCTSFDPEIDPDPSFTGSPWEMFEFTGTPTPVNLLVVFLGNNDPKVSTPEQFKQRLAAIVDHITDQRLADTLYLVRPPRNDARPEWDDRLQSYGDAILEVAAANSRVHVGLDLWNGMAPQFVSGGFEHTELADLLESEISQFFTRDAPGPGRWLIPGIGVLGALFAKRFGRWIGHPNQVRIG